ncbi:transcriptional protein SWT1 isoform X1 [Bombus huntii]|uniref:transcriptional protein SWT1 isoform X1 n=2 Tax=Bombus huntii TaxID=85661 RepID=UPI0021A97C7A|nr:transcriptional protein SWT1 isoform X1 [Bombus huntii]
MMKHKLPENWSIRNSKRYPHKIYYFNEKTKQSSWDIPTEDQTEQVEKKLGRSAKKRKQSQKMNLQNDEDNEAQFTVSERNPSEGSASDKEITRRNILTAKRFHRQTQTKANEGKETPQMKEIRQKMLKKREKIIPRSPQSSKSTKDVSKSPPSRLGKISPLSQKTDVYTYSKESYTPQMQILLEKRQGRTSKSNPKKKTEEDRSNVIDKGENPIKTRLRNQNVSKQKSVSEVSSPSESRSQREVQKGPKVGKRKSSNSGEDIPKVQGQKSLKTNLGKERMERLKTSLSSQQCDDNLSHNSPTSSTPAKKFNMPCIFKNTQVRLERLEETRVNNKIANNKSVYTREIKGAANASKDPITTVDNIIKWAYEDSVCEEMPMPSVYKDAEVRLERLRERCSNDKIATNTNLSPPKVKETANASKNLITTSDDLVKSAYEDAFCEEMDWEPLEDEKIMFEVQAVRTQLCTENNVNTTCNIPSNTSKYPLLSEQQAKRHLYIVVDTNVFLSNIDAVELAREAIFKTYDHSIITIPWTVIRELDYIKDDNGKSRPISLCFNARKAINYINKLFSSKQSYVIGQTPEDVAKNKERFSIDCPDDEILQTCLQIRDLGKSVVLLSYDVNLCNKAMIYDIVTLGRNDPLEKVDYLNATNVNKPLSISNNGNRERISLNSTSIMCEELQLSDEIYEDIKSVIRDFLTVIVSKEMYALYGSSWEKYVIIKPPWTTVTVLQCAVKHWIAATSESFRRAAEYILKELLQIFKDISGPKTLKENSYILDKFNDLVQMVNIDKHSVLMLRISKKIDELKDKCREYESQINNHKLCNVIGVEDDVEEQERRAQKAFQYFEAAYVYARDMTGITAKTIGMPCTLHYNVPNPVPSVEFIKKTIPEIATNVNKLERNLSAVIEQVKNSCTDYRTLIHLYQTLITFLPENALIALKLNDVKIEPLDVYCCVKRKEDVLNRGLRQLQELNIHFSRLANY